jgi:hypothetical protein
VANRAYACDKQAPQEPEPEPTNLRELTVKQVREMAKSNGIPGSSRMSKSQIIKALAES